MDRYLINKYKGTYRVRAKLDLSTDDFVRDADGNLDESFADFYIKCRNGFEIYHYYRDTLGIYNENPTKGKNLIYKIYEDKISPKPLKDYQRIVDKLLKEEIILSYLETKQDFDIHFKAADLDYFANILKPEVNGANISPFSIKNLPKTPYIIPEVDLKPYTEIVNQLPGDNTTKLVTINKANSLFKQQKQKELSNFDFAMDMRNSKLKFKQYIHSKDWWNEYISFLKGELLNEI